MTTPSLRPPIRVEPLDQARSQECCKRKNLAEAWVDVWWASFDYEEKISLASFSQREIRRYREIASRERAEQFAWGRVLLRRCLSLYLDCSPAEISIASSRWGKPELSPETRLFFNISHSEDAFAIAVASVEIGIDVENRTPSRGFLRMLSVREKEAVHEPGHPGCAEALARIWSRKEALLKAWGCGFAEAAKAPEVPCGDGIVTRSDGTRWYIADIDLPVARAAAIALRLCDQAPVSERRICGIHTNLRSD